MKQLLIFITSILLLTNLVSCSNAPTKDTDSSTQIVVMPDNKTAATVNGYKAEIKENTGSNINTDLSDTENKENVYYANKSSKKFHLSSCSYARAIKKENLLKMSNRNDLAANGYEPCKKCNP